MNKRSGRAKSEFDPSNSWIYGALVLTLLLLVRAWALAPSLLKSPQMVRSLASLPENNISAPSSNGAHRFASSEGNGPEG
jgi:hypothetical protein